MKKILGIVFLVVFTMSNKANARAQCYNSSGLITNRVCCVSGSTTCCMTSSWFRASYSCGGGQNPFEKPIRSKDDLTSLSHNFNQYVIERREAEDQLIKEFVNSDFEYMKSDEHSEDKEAAMDEASPENKN